jgi:hypothetical protein
VALCTVSRTVKNMSGPVQGAVDATRHRSADPC